MGIFFSLHASLFAKQPDWVLSGTFLNNEHAHAMFVGSNGEELLLERGDDIQGCNLINVLKDSARIRCSGQDYNLLIRSSVGDVLLQAQLEQSTVQKQTIVLSKNEITNYLEKKQQLISEIGFLPLVENEQVIGFTLSKIKPGTKAASLGLYNGDVIKSVNGVSAAESELFVETLQELAKLPEITLEVDRYGRSISYTYLLN